MCMTETWISSSALDIIDGYSCYISPRCSASGEPMTHGGGVGFYCKENIPHRILDVAVPKTHDIEVSWPWARPKGLPRQVSSLIYATSAQIERWKDRFSTLLNSDIVIDPDPDLIRAASLTPVIPLDSNEGEPFS
ncbi:hypothetical protein QYM36_001275 [Artemia franciscana]|uniref:Uncharacterized protein n=1 Tax=Artemia franciscana TaxID=6661 RepID=A0AA88LK08_ARTSF|nr:hypothetical protein QYM36_001275 [Artemia franciscana]